MKNNLTVTPFIQQLIGRQTPYMQTAKNERSRGETEIPPRRPEETLFRHGAVLQGVCTFVPSGRFSVVSEILVKAVLGEAQPARLFSNHEW